MRVVGWLVFLYSPYGADVSLNKLLFSPSLHGDDFVIPRCDDSLMRKNFIIRLISANSF